MLGDVMTTKPVPPSSALSGLGLNRASGSAA